MNQDQVKQLNEAIEAVKGHEIENIYFVACGGSKAETPAEEKPAEEKPVEEKPAEEKPAETPEEK